MLRFPLLHPELLAALASAGHGSRVLIADGNYPAATGIHRGARLIHLNLTPGIVNVPDVLAAVNEAIPVEAVHVMAPDKGPEPPIFEELRRILGPGLPLQKLSRFAFYEAAREPELAVAVQTAEQRAYANVLLTVGVVPPDWRT